MIFITSLLKIVSTSWTQILYKKTVISYYILTKKKYTPFKKFLKIPRGSFSTNPVNLPIFDKYNANSLQKTYNKQNFQLLFVNIQTLILPYWRRVVFKGKGFRLRKFKNSRKLTFNFGHSHWTKLRLRAYFVLFKRKRRQSQYFFCFYKLLFEQLCLVISNLRRINKYTKRGLRLKKQPIIRRFGKISQMLSAHNY